MPGDRAITTLDHHPHRRWGWGLVAALAAGLLVAGLVLVTSTRTGKPGTVSVQPSTVHSGGPPGHSRSGLGTGTQATRGPLGTTVTTEGPAPNTSPVVQPRTYVSDIEMSGSLLIIPSLHVRAPLVPTGAVGAPETASLTIPADIHEVGWWDGNVRDGDRTVQEAAPAPGQPGVALIAGHVDSAAAGPGALFDLGNLTVGDRLEISDSTSHLSTWVVDAKPESTPKAQLPPALWVTTGPPKLALVTCGGPFDAATGHYVDNVIVWARQLSRSETR